MRYTTVLSIIGIIILFLGWLLEFIIPEAGDLTWVTTIVGIGLLTSSFILDFRHVKKTITSRKGLFGVGTSITLVIFIGILSLANIISSKAFHRFDFTGLSQFTLTSQTQEVLNTLDTSIEIMNFLTPSIDASVSNYTRDFLNEYASYSEKIVVKEIDLELRPDIARQYNVDQMGAILGAVIFRSDLGQKQVLGPEILSGAEHSFTSAILEVSGQKQKKVYFLTGHGENNIKTDYSNVQEGLRDNLFQTAEFDLLTERSIPKEASAIVIAGPKALISDYEISQLKLYLDTGGRVLILLDPDPQAELKQLLSEWWLYVMDGFVVDPNSYVAPNLEIPLISRDRNVFQFSELYFPGVAAINPLEGVPNDVQLGTLVESTPYAWIEKEVPSGNVPEFNPDSETKSSLALGAIVSKGKTRLAVIGDSDFATNQHFLNGNNSALFLSTINWLTEDEEIISVDRKVLPVRRLVLSSEEARLLNVSSIGIFPILLLITGIIVWWRRR